MKFSPSVLKEIVADMPTKPNILITDVLTFSDVRKWGLCNLILEDKSSRLERGILAYVNRDNPTFVKDKINDDNRLVLMVDKKAKPDCLYFYNTSLEDEDTGEKDSTFLLNFVPPLDVVPLPYQKSNEEAYTQYVRNMVDQGLKDADEGNTVSHAEVGKRLGIGKNDKD